jgi:hypothetical protein
VSGPSLILRELDELVLARRVHGDARPDVARGFPLARRHIHVAEARCRRQSEREELVVGREILLAQALDILRELVRSGVRPPRLAQREAVAEQGTDSGFLQRLDGGIGVRRRLLDVRPIDDRGNAGIERAQRADEIADIDVVRAIVRAVLAENEAKIVAQRAVRDQVADRAFPHVAVAVNKARHHDHLGCINHFRSGRCEI